MNFVQSFPLFIKPFAVIVLTLTATSLFSSLVHRQTLTQTRTPPDPGPMAAARSFILWLHGLGDSGPANEPIRTLFASPEFKTIKWLFPSAPHSPVSCNCKWVARLPIFQFLLNSVGTSGLLEKKNWFFFKIPLAWIQIIQFSLGLFDIYSLEYISRSCFLKSKFSP